MGAERAKEQTKDQAPAKRRGLLGRLVRLVAFLGFAGAIALVAGFKVQKQVTYPAGDRTVTIEAGKWAWEDTDAFVAYSRCWMGWTREQLVALDRQVGATDKVKAGAGAAADGIKKGYDAVQERIHATPGAGDTSGPDRGDLDRQERDEHFGYTERELEKLPAGYYEALKGGHEALRQGIDAHKKWARDRERGTEKAWDLSNAEERFRAAQTNFERCRELYPDDRRPEIQLKLVQEYLQQIAKDRPADY